MAGQEELIIKLIILTVVLVALGVGGYFGYKYYQKECPDGLFVCMGIDDAGGAGPGGAAAGAGAGSGSGSGSGSGTTDDGFTKSDLYDKCSRFLVPNDTRTCMTGTTVGVRWDWSTATNNSELEECKNATKKWKIIISSSGENNHGTKREFTIPNSDANSMIVDFGLAAEQILKNHNVKFRIIPINDNNEQITPALTMTVDNESANDKTCSTVGGVITSLTDFITVQPPSEAVKIPNIDCSGYWKTGNCTSKEPGKCGPGTISRKWITTTVSSGNGESCPASSSQPCQVTQNCVNPSDDSPPPNCELDSFWTNATDAVGMKKVLSETYPEKLKEYDIVNIDPVHSVRLGDGSMGNCTKANNGDIVTAGSPGTPPVYSELPGFYMRHKGIAFVSEDAFKAGKCTYNLADTIEVGMCNNKPMNRNCVMGDKLMENKPSVTKKCKQKIQGMGNYKVYTKTFTPREKIVLRQPQGDGSSCYDVGGTFWNAGTLVDTGNDINCRTTSRGDCSADVPTYCFMTSPPAP